MELRVHDLVRLASPAPVITAGAPSWVASSLEAAPWVVVRRAAAEAGHVSVGVRGRDRTERFAATIDLSGALARLSPEALSNQSPPRPHPAFDAMVALAPTLDAAGLPWGPVGAAGYELATGRQALTEGSDLDLILRARDFRAMWRLAPLAEAATRSALRVDILVETPLGGAALAELLGGADEILVRTARGPRLFGRRGLIGDEAAS